MIRTPSMNAATRLRIGGRPLVSTPMCGIAQTLNGCFCMINGLELYKKGGAMRRDHQEPLAASAGPARRRLLTAFAAATAAEYHGLLLPERWRRPLVKSVILPAHAQMSANGLSCSAGSLTVDNAVQNGDAQGHIAIIYDGAEDCSLIQVITDSADGGASGNPDEMLLLDADENPVENFDLRGPNYGANWGPGPDSDNNDEGAYSFDIERVAPPNNGTTFRIEFNVSFSGSEMTVSNVQINAL